VFAHSEIFDFRDNLSNERGYLIELSDAETGVHEATDIHTSHQCRGAAYRDGPSIVCLKTANSSTDNCKQTCIFHMIGCSSPAKHAHDDENAVVTHHSVH
jgi:hypothetical protein